MEKRIENMSNKGIIKTILNKETILYLVFGVFTTIVNFGSFIIFEKICGEKFYLLANVGAKVILAFVAVLANYIFGKFFVFKNSQR